MVNLKNMVGKVKAVLTGGEANSANAMEAKVLQALQNQDFAAAFAALPQQADELVAVWLGQIRAKHAGYAQKIEAFLSHKGVALDIYAMPHDVADDVFNVFARPLDDFSYASVACYVRTLPEQPLPLLLRVQWYRLLLQGKIDSKLAEKMQCLWQDLAHARSSYSRYYGGTDKTWAAAFADIAEILRLQWQATFSSASLGVLPKVNLGRLQQVFGAADWQDPSDVLTVLFNNHGNAVRLQQCEDLDAWLLAHVGAIRAWYEAANYYINVDWLLIYASGNKALQQPLLAVWVACLLDKEVSTRMLTIGILRQIDVAAVVHELNKTAAVADKPAAMLAKLAEHLPHLGEAYASVLEDWQAKAKTSAAKKPYATALSKLTLAELVQNTALDIPVSPVLQASLPEKATIALLKQNVENRQSQAIHQQSWAQSRLKELQEADTSQLDADELAWHKEVIATSIQDEKDATERLQTLSGIADSDYALWYQKMNTFEPLTDAELGLTLGEQYYYARTTYYLDLPEWLPAHTAAQYGVWNRKGLEYACGHLERSVSWNSLLAHLQEIGCDASKDIFWSMLSTSYQNENLWQQAWPLLAKNLNVLEQTCGLQAVDTPQCKLRVEKVVDALFAFPSLPSSLQYSLALWAYGSNRSLREQAQALLSKQEQALAWAAWGLNHDYADVRKLSIAWLVGLQAASAQVIPLLNARMQVEDDTKLRVQLLQGLIALQADVSAYLSEAALLAEIAPVMAKKRPKAMEWLAWEEMPVLQWQDGRPVSPELLEGWLRLSMQMKEANGEGMWQIYLGLLDAPSQDALGLFALKQFVSEDLRPMTDAELNELIDKEVPKKLKKFQKDYEQYPNYYTEYKDITEEQVRAKLVEEIGRYNDKQTALPHKGLLALTGAIATDEWYRTFRRYQRDFAYKTKQLGALIQAAAAGNNASVLPLIASLDVKASGNYIRTLSRATIAEYQERHEWTDEQIADYVVPAFGMDAYSRLSLSYGERAFVLRLHVDGEWTIQDDSGKELRALPPARKTEDAEWVKAIKAQYASIKKDVKNVLKQEQHRLYVAMCSERVWTGAVWQQVVAQQPIMRLLAQRLIWQVKQGEQTLLLRLDEQGEMLDAEDNTHSIDASAQVKLAHGTGMSDAEREAWAQHFADYQITPLFNQLQAALGGAWQDKSASDFEGHSIPYYTLRSVVAKHGFNVNSYDYYGEDSYHLNLGSKGSISICFDAQGELGYGSDRSNVMVWLTDVRYHSDEAMSPVIQAEAFAAYQAAADASNGKDPKWKKSA